MSGAGGQAGDWPTSASPAASVAESCEAEASAATAFWRWEMLNPAPTPAATSATTVTHGAVSLWPSAASRE